MTNLNLEAALAAANNTASRTFTSKNGQFKTDCLEIFKAYKKPMTVAQVRDAYNAGLGTDLGSKYFADRLWSWSTRSKNKNPSLRHFDGVTGLYALIDYQGAPVEDVAPDAESVAEDVAPVAKDVIDIDDV